MAANVNTVAPRRTSNRDISPPGRGGGGHVSRFSFRVDSDFVVLIPVNVSAVTARKEKTRIDFEKKKIWYIKGIWKL